MKSSLNQFYKLASWKSLVMKCQGTDISSHLTCRVISMSLKFYRKWKNDTWNNLSGSRIEDKKMTLQDQYNNISFDKISICDLQSTCRSLAWAISWEIQSQIHFGYFQSWFVQTCSALKNDFNANCFVIWISYWMYTK